MSANIDFHRMDLNILGWRLQSVPEHKAPRSFLSASSAESAVTRSPRARHWQGLIRTESIIGQIVLSQS